ncbi:T9SS type A sorting domain-containing protein [Chitinophagaceae bacterium MMS25-I14]
MKKIYLYLFLFLFPVSGTFAQQYTDLGLQLVTPSQNMVLTANDTLIYLSFTVKNNGPDTIHSGDVIRYSYLMDGYIMPMIYNGSMADTLGATAPADIPPTDSFTVTSGLTGFDSSLAGNRTFCVQLQEIIISSGTLIDTVATNNSSCAAITVIIRPTGISSPGNMYLNAVSVSPNPAYTDIHFGVNMNAGSPVVLQLTDITGKVVYSYSGILQSGKNSITVPAGNFVPGMYLYRIAAGAEIKTGKISVEK